MKSLIQIIILALCMMVVYAGCTGGQNNDNPLVGNPTPSAACSTGTNLNDFNAGKSAGATDIINSQNAGKSDADRAINNPNLTSAQGSTDGLSRGYFDGFIDGYLNGGSCGPGTKQADADAPLKNPIDSAQGTSDGTAEGNAAGTIEGQEQGFSDGYGDGYDTGLHDAQKICDPIATDHRDVSQQSSCFQQGYVLTTVGSGGGCDILSCINFHDTNPFASQYTWSFLNEFDNKLFGNHNPYATAFAAIYTPELAVGKSDGAKQIGADVFTQCYAQELPIKVGGPYAAAFTPAYNNAVTASHSIAYNSPNGYPAGQGEGYPLGRADGGAMCAAGQQVLISNSQFHLTVSPRTGSGQTKMSEATRRRLAGANRQLVSKDLESKLQRQRLLLREVNRAQFQLRRAIVGTFSTF